MRAAINTGHLFLEHLRARNSHDYFSQEILDPSSQPLLSGNSHSFTPRYVAPAAPASSSTSSMGPSNGDIDGNPFLAGEEEGNHVLRTERNSSSSAKPVGLAKGAPKVGTWMLVGLIYYSVSGGPLGMEVAVRAGGPMLALLGFLVMPLVWSVPEAAMTAELSIAYPEAAGFAAWTNAAFGPFWSFQCSMMSYFSGVLDNAVYPVLLLQYVAHNQGVGELAAAWGWVVILSFTVVMTYLTWRGLDVNGVTCVFLAGFGLLPFVVFCVAGLPEVDPSNWTFGPIARHPDDSVADDGSGGVAGDWSDVKWRSLLNVLFWNLNYYDSSSAFSGDCHEPAKTFPRAMALAVMVVSLSYLLPLAVATGARPRADYCDGCYVEIATDVAGPWLGVWITIAAAVSCVGLFIAEMASDSFQLMGMADRGQLPKVLSGRSRYGTPTLAIGMSAMGVIAAAPLDFEAIIELVNILYCFSELLEFAAFIQLRRDRPLHAPPSAWQIPCVKSPFGAALFFLPATVLLVTVVALSSALGFVVAAAAIGTTTSAYLFICVARSRKWVHFAPAEAGWDLSRDPAWVQTAVRFFEWCSGGSHAKLSNNRHGGEGGAFSPVPPTKNYTQSSPLHHEDDLMT